MALGFSTWKKWPLLAAMVVLLIVAAAMSPWSTGTAHASVRSAHAAKAAKSPIMVGDTCDCSGLGAASNAGWYPGLEVWADYTNAHGGVMGHPVKIDEEDTKTDPVATLTDTKALEANQKVLALILGSTVTDLTSAINAGKAPVVGGLVSAPLFGGNKYTYPAATSFGSLFNLMAAAAAKGQTNKKFAILYCAESDTCAGGIPVLTAGIKAAGGSVVYQASISASSSSYTAQCLAAQSAGAGIVAMIDVATVNVEVASSCASSGYKPTYTAPAFATTYLGSSAMDGARFPLGDEPYTSDATFVAAVKKYDPSLAKSPYWGEVPFEAWVSGQAFAQAIKLAKPSGSITRATVIKGLDLFHNQTLGGVAPPLTFTKGKIPTVSCGYPGEIKGGKLVELSKAICVG
jgi:branched-chain amino acid transport system substrate-binding protein